MRRLVVIPRCVGGGSRFGALFFPDFGEGSLHVACHHSDSLTLADYKFSCTLFVDVGRWCVSPRLVESVPVLGLVRHSVAILVDIFFFGYVGNVVAALCCNRA